MGIDVTERTFKLICETNSLNDLPLDDLKVLMALSIGAVRDKAGKDPTCRALRAIANDFEEGRNISSETI